jgi:hypothetical protein
LKNVIRARKIKAARREEEAADPGILLIRATVVVARDERVVLI